MSRSPLCSLLLALAAAHTTAAHAAPVLETFDFTGSNFVFSYIYGSAPSPLGTVSGSVTISFTPGAYVYGFDASGAPTQSFQLQGLPTPATQATYSYAQGSKPGGGSFIFDFFTPGQNFSLAVTFQSAVSTAKGNLTQFAAPALYYDADLTAIHDNFAAQQASGSVAPATAPLPEPDSIILLGTALVTALSLLRRPNNA